MAKRTIRILSIDGGGIRGIIPVMVLDALEKAIQKETKNDNARLVDYFDFIAGTSIGGIIACALLVPADDTTDPKYSSKYSAANILGLFENYGKKIFYDTPFSDFLEIKIFSFLNDLFKGIDDEKYSAVGLEGVLKKYFGKLELKNLLKPCLIPAYNTEQRRTFFFSQQKAQINGENSNFYVKDVCRGTSAAPTVFEVALIESLGGVKFPLIDGGIFANNPSLCALAEVRKTKQSPKVENIILVSLGTGSVRTPYFYDDIKDKSTIGMIPAIIDMMMSGVSETIDYQVRKMFEARNVADQYFRIDAPNLTNEEAELDNASASNIERLKATGLQTASNNDLDKIAVLLVKVTQDDKARKVDGENYKALDFKKTS